MLIYRSDHKDSSWVGGRNELLSDLAAKEKACACWGRKNIETSGVVGSIFF